MPYHSLKNCPNPPNLNIAMQAFLEFTMQQLTVFSMEKRFAFPAGVFSVPQPVAPPAAVSQPATKSKKEKTKVVKKSKKSAKKKIKIEAKEESDESDDDDDDDDQASPDATSSDSDSASSAEPQPTVNKSKRKRSSKQPALPPAPSMPSAAAFPFSMLAAGTPYNSLMYPYGASFNFPK